MCLKYAISEIVQLLASKNLEFKSQEESGMPLVWINGTKIPYGRKELTQNSSK
jgi:hypothetical protein